MIILDAVGKIIFIGEIKRRLNTCGYIDHRAGEELNLMAEEFRRKAGLTKSCQEIIEEAEQQRQYRQEQLAHVR